MHASLFSLVTTEDPSAVFAWGIEMVDYLGDEEERRKTIVHLGGPNGPGTISTHDTAEKACARWSKVVPLDIVWDAEQWLEAAHMTATSSRP